MRATTPSTAATNNNAPPQSALGLAVVQTKKKKKKKLKIDVDVLTGEVSIDGRPDFNTRAKKLIGKADQNKDLDRRHIIHYDEEIKPFGELVIQKVKAKHGNGTAAVVKKALESRGCQRLPSSEADLLSRMVSEVNSSVINLVPDDASINKAIEIVRENLRKLQKEFATDPKVQQIFIEMDATNFKQAMDLLKTHAKQILSISGASTDITLAIQAINQDIVKFIDGAQNIQDLYTLINDLQTSVTFDMSSKAAREKVEFANAWLRKKLLLETNARSGVDNTDELLEHFVTLIQQY